VLAALAVSIRLVTADDVGLIAQLETWAEEASVSHERAPMEFAHLLDAMKMKAVPNAVNYGIYAPHLVGGIGTSGEYFNVMWLHWDHTQRGIGARAAHQVLALQLKSWGRAIVNQPNAKMCKALRKIMIPARAARIDCAKATSAIHIAPGELK
jgi:hypothetical protein